MIAAFIAFLSAIPGLGALITGGMRIVYDAKVRIYQAKTGATQEVAKAAVTALAVDSHERSEQWKTIAGSKALLFLVAGFATPFIIFTWQCVVWDIVLCPHFQASRAVADAVCSTDPIKGQLADWATTIIGSLFGSSTAVAVTHIASKAIGNVWGKEA